MAVVPNPLILDYKQLSGVFQTEFINYIEPHTGDLNVYLRQIVVENQPDWVSITRQSVGEGRVVINNAIENQTAGLKVINMVLRMSILHEDPYRPGMPMETLRDLGTLQLRMNVIQTIRLSAIPSPLAFTYVLGGLEPSPIALTVQSESAWNIIKTKTWTGLSVSTGSGIGSINVSVNPVGLSVGTHTDVLTITDALFTTTVPVSLTITEPDTETTFLYVAPSAMTINYTVGGYLPIRQVELNASGSWTATPSAPWIALSQTSGFDGVAFLTLSLDEAVALTLTEGVFVETVVFEQGGLVKTLYITLNVYELVESLLNDTDLYFTDDNNRIILSSLREGTFLALQMSSNFENNIVYGDFDIPFYAGRGERRIGSFPKKVIGQRPMLPDVATVQLFTPYQVALINLAITEEDVSTDQVYQVIPVNNVQFIKGITPQGGWLSEMPPVRFLTKKGIAAFSFLSNNNVADLVTITGDISASFNISNAVNPFYSCLVPMDQLATLQVGHTIDITVLDKTLKIHITREGQDHCLIFWENKWGCWDTFECTGEVIVETDFTIDTFKFRKDYALSETKTLSVEMGNSFKIDTGWVRSHDEIVGLTNLLKSKNVYVQYNGTLSKVNNSTRKLKLSETNREEPSFDLTFDNAIS